MKDVAIVANVSVQTVSAVINEAPGISEETRKRVLAAVDQLGYRPYTVARSLRTRSTHTIALIVSDITNPFFSTVASVAEDYAHAAGYSLLLYNTHFDANREQYYYHTVLDRWVDGLLFVTTFDQPNGLDAIIKAGIPIVAIDRIPENYTGASVSLDNKAAGRMAAEHLLDLGHTHIAHISGPLELRLSRERLHGFQEAIRSRGLEPGPSFAGDRQWSSNSGFCAMQSILALPDRPTAVFSANDRMAIGAMHAIMEAGLSIPADISVVGVDDIELAAFQNPPLTTVAQSVSNVATAAVKTLLEMMDGKDASQPQIVLEPVLRVRNSTTRPLKE